MKLTNLDKNIRLAVCVPCRDTLHSLFAYNLTQLVQTCNHIGISVSIFMEIGSLIAQQRQKLAEAAIEGGSTHILWLDSDMLFPVYVAEKLLSHELDVVACNYSTRSLPIKGVAYDRIGEWDSWKSVVETTDTLAKVEGIGMGCMLVKTDVFLKLDKPWFNTTWESEYSDFIGEDFYFCKKARDADFSIMVDTVLSKSIGHIGISKFDLSRCVNQR